MASLLGQFYTRIKGSQEDIASEGLVYILQRSISARKALNKVIQFESGLEFEEINYITQNIGEKLERPDISGFDIKGKEVIILEAKFWASLTENQPIEYLKRLGENSILIFVCPSLRVRPVFDELSMRLQKAEFINEIKYENHSFKLDDNKTLLVKTWGEILGIIRLQLVQDNEQTLLSDIDQLIGLCETIDNNSFQPYQSEDFAPAFAKRINSYYDLVDKVIDELKKRNLADTTNLNSAPQKYGYTRYFKIDNFGCSLNVRFDFWERVADTPFWLSIKDDTTGKLWIQNETFKALIKSIASKKSILTYENNKRELFIPIFPLLDKTEDIVVNEITDKIIKINTELKENNKSNTLVF
ncbi:MAG: hypothetical protein ACOYLE_07055 [Bacteroidales bacterium]